MWNLRIPIHSYFTARAEKNFPYVDPQVCSQEAQSYLSEGKLLEAEGFIDAALRLDDHFAPAYVLRAMLRGRQGDLSGARLDIQTALNLTPDSADALFVSAMIATSLNDTASAKADVQKALQNAPPNWPSRNEAEKLLEKLRTTVP